MCNGQYNIALSILAFIPSWSSCGMSIHSWCDGSSDRPFMVDPLSHLSFQPALHDSCSKGCGMCYPACLVVHIKDPFLLIEKSSPCSGSSRFPLSLYEWSFNICLTPYDRIKKVLSASFNNNISFLFFLLSIIVVSVIHQRQWYVVSYL